MTDAPIQLGYDRGTVTVTGGPDGFAPATLPGVLFDPRTMLHRAQEDLSIAFLHLLEKLGPEERAAFVLHDVFECDYDDIAEVLNKGAAACRQLVHRAR